MSLYNHFIVNKNNTQSSIGNRYTSKLINVLDSQVMGYNLVVPTLLGSKQVAWMLASPST